MKIILRRGMWGNIGRYFLNTIILAAGTIILTGVFGAMASYILSKISFQNKIGYLSALYLGDDDTDSGCLNPLSLMCSENSE